MKRHTPGFSATYDRHPLPGAGLPSDSNQATKKLGHDWSARPGLSHPIQTSEAKRDKGLGYRLCLRNCGKARGTTPFVSPAFWTKTKATRCFHFPISIPKRFGSEHSGNRFALMLALPQPPIRVPLRLLYLVRAEHERGRRVARTRNDTTVTCWSRSPTDHIQLAARKCRPPTTYPTLYGSCHAVSSYSKHVPSDI